MLLKLILAGFVFPFVAAGLVAVLGKMPNLFLRKILKGIVAGSYLIFLFYVLGSFLADQFQFLKGLYLRFNPSPFSPAPLWLFAAFLVVAAVAKIAQLLARAVSRRRDHDAK